MKTRITISILMLTLLNFGHALAEPSNYQCKKIFSYELTAEQIDYLTNIPIPKFSFKYWQTYKNYFKETGGEINYPAPKTGLRIEGFVKHFATSEYNFLQAIKYISYKILNSKMVFDFDIPQIDKYNFIKSRFKKIKNFADVDQNMSQETLALIDVLENETLSSLSGRANLYMPYNSKILGL